MIWSERELSRLKASICSFSRSPIDSRRAIDPSGRGRLEVAVLGQGIGALEVAIFQRAEPAGRLAEFNRDRRDDRRRLWDDNCPAHCRDM